MSRKSHIHNQIFEDLSRFPPVIRSFFTMKNKHPPPPCEKSAEQWQGQLKEERQSQWERSAGRLIIARKSSCNLSQLRCLVRGAHGSAALPNENTTSGDLRHMNSWSVFPSLLLCGSSKCQWDQWPLEESLIELRLLPLNNGSLGAAKRGPGTNVAIMLMVRITGDGHYWPHLGLACRGKPSSHCSHGRGKRFGYQGLLRWWAVGRLGSGGIGPVNSIQQPSFPPPFPSSLAVPVVVWWTGIGEMFSFFQLKSSGGDRQGWVTGATQM